MIANNGDISSEGEPTLTAATSLLRFTPPTIISEYKRLSGKALVPYQDGLLAHENDRAGDERSGSILEQNWQASFKKLQAFCMTNRILTSPKNMPILRFSSGAVTKRTKHNGTLTKQRIDCLDSVKLSFRAKTKTYTDEKMWRKQFKKLEAFQKDKGHWCDATPKQGDSAYLAKWCAEK
jgi:hypothetical protein